MRRGLTSQRLLALFAVGALLFNFPLLRLFDQDALLFGLPLLPTALFAAWALLIVVLAGLLETDPEEDRLDDPQDHGPDGG